MEATYSFGTLIHMYQSTRRHITGDNKHSNHRIENLESKVFFSVSVKSNIKLGLRNDFLLVTENCF